jgi:hypothetical protein
MRSSRCALRVAQRGAQAFLDHRVIEGAVEHLLHGVAALGRPGEQVADVFGGRADHLRAEETLAAALGVHMQRSLVAADHPAAALVRE